MTNVERKFAEQEVFALEIVNFWQKKVVEEVEKQVTGGGSAKYEAFVRARLLKEVLGHKQFPAIRECYGDYFGEK